MKKLAALALSVPLFAGVMVGVDYGHYSGEETNVKSAKVKAGYEFMHITPYAYAQRDTINVLDFSLSDSSYGGGVDGRYMINMFGVTAGASYGRGGLLGTRYVDRSVNAGVLLDVKDGVMFEAGYKRKRLEIEDVRETFKGGYAGILIEF